MASRTSSRGRSAARSSRSSGSGSSSQPLVFGGIGLAVVIALVVMMNRGGSGSPAKGGAEPVAADKPAGSAAASPASAPVQLASAKAGKTPKRAAPPLTAATLQQVRDLLASAKALCNEGVTARTAGDNTKAREKQGLAKDKLVALKELVAVQSLWQEEAQLEDWAQPAEYMTLEKLYADISKLEKQVRMGGG